MVVLAVAVGELQKDVIAANEQKLLSDQAAGEILEVCLKINAAAYDQPEYSGNKYVKMGANPGRRKHEEDFSGE